MGFYKRDPLTQEEVDRLAGACQIDQERLVVWTLLDTGIRVSDLAQMERFDWDEFDGSMPYVRFELPSADLVLLHKWCGGPEFPDTECYIELSERVESLLRQHFTRYRTFGMSSRTIQRLVRRVARQAGIYHPVTPHVLRHTFAAAAVARGCDPRALREHLGHAHLRTTLHYFR